MKTTSLHRNGAADRAVKLDHEHALGRLIAAIKAATDETVMLNEAVRIVCDALDTPLGKVLEYDADSEQLLIRAGAGWHKGVVGDTPVSADSRSQAGYTLRLREPVVFDDLTGTHRFTDALVLRSHGVVSSLSVTIVVEGGPFGVLSVHDTRKRQFTSADFKFVDAAARVIASRLAEMRRRPTNELPTI